MTVYCFSCGSKITYSAVKPKTCESCGDLLEPKPVAKEQPREKPRAEKRRPGYDPIERDEEGIGEESEGFDIEALKRSVKLVRDGNEGGFPTVTAEWARNGGGGRGEAPAIEGREEVLNGLLTGKGSGKVANDTPPAGFDQPRSAVRRQPNRFAVKE